jgi:hypothetical protein
MFNFESPGGVVSPKCLAAIDHLADIKPVAQQMREPAMVRFLGRQLRVGTATASRADQASALLNAARNVGSSIGVSLGNNVLASRTVPPEPACRARQPVERSVSGDAETGD